MGEGVPPFEATVKLLRNQRRCARKVNSVNNILLAELVQDAPLGFPGGLPVPRINRLEVFPSGLLGHDVTLLCDGGW